MRTTNKKRTGVGSKFGGHMVLSISPFIGSEFGVGSKFDVDMWINNYSSIQSCRASLIKYSCVCAI